MRIDPKYFNKFITVVALAAALLIVFFTIHNQNSREEAFRDAVYSSDSLRYTWLQHFDRPDSLQLKRYKGRFVVLNFWSTWSPPSQDALNDLLGLKQRYDSTLVVIAAAAKDTRDNVEKYRRNHAYPFEFVDGTALFNALHAPGVPSQVIFDPKGRIMAIETGYKGAGQLDTLSVRLQQHSHP